jgi:hypothetical protein
LCDLLQPLTAKPTENHLIIFSFLS